MYRYAPSAKPNTRIDVADILRGIAIAGIIILHFLEQMNFYRFREPTSEFWAATNQVIWDSTFFLLAGKMYAIFSILFGLSFFIQHDNQAQKGIDFRPRFVWRMCILMMFGLFDLLFFNGDILFLYATCGLLIIPLIRASNKVILAAAILMFIQPVELIYLVRGLIDPMTSPLNVGSGDCWGPLYEASSNGSFFDVAKAGLRYGFPVNFLWAIENGRMTQTVCLFLFGILLGRKRLFYNEGNNLVTWKNIFVAATIGFAVMTPLFYLVPKTADAVCVSKSLNVMFNMWKNFCMTFMFISGVTLLYYKTSAKNWLIKLAPFGKMSLTNYLAQSIIGGFLYYNWGLGLFRHCGHTASFFMGISVVILLNIFCTWWLKNHRRGPFEELWNQATWFGKHK